MSLHVLFLIGDDADGPAADARVTAENGFTVFGAIFFKFAGVHNACDDFAHVVLLGGIAGENSVDFVAWIERLARCNVAERRRIRRAHFVDERANPRDARVVVRLAKIHRAANLRVHFRAAQIFGGSDLSDGRLHQRGAGQEKSRAFGHQNVVAHQRQVRSASNAHAHDGGELGNAHRAHHRVVAKNAAKIVRIGENVFLQRQEIRRRNQQDKSSEYDFRWRYSARG